MTIKILTNVRKGIPRVNGQVFCDGCQLGKATVKIGARPGPNTTGYVERTMRLCQECAKELHFEIDKWFRTPTPL